MITVIITLIITETALHNKRLTNNVQLLVNHVQKHHMQKKQQ